MSNFTKALLTSSAAFALIAVSLPAQDSAKAKAAPKASKSKILQPQMTPAADGGTYAGGASVTFALLVTDTEGLTNCNAQTVTIP